MSIRWLTGIGSVVTAGMITILLTGAEAADRIVSVRQIQHNLSGAQKSALGDAAVNLFPGIVKANTFALWCVRKNTGLKCYAKETKTGTAAQFYTDFDDPNIIAEETNWSDPTSTWIAQRQNLSLTAQNRTDLATFIATVWASADATQITHLFCNRDEDDATVIDCNMRELQTLAPGDARTAILNNPGSQDVGVVEP